LVFFCSNVPSAATAAAAAANLSHFSSIWEEVM